MRDTQTGNMTPIAKMTVAVTLAAGSLVIFLIWSAFATFFLYLMSFGDGSASAGPEDVRTFYLPSVYLLFVAISCLPFFRRWSLLGIGIAAHTILLLAFLRLAQHERVGGTFVLFMSIPFAFIVLGWFALCAGRFRGNAERRRTEPRPRAAGFR